MTPQGAWNARHPQPAAIPVLRFGAHAAVIRGLLSSEAGADPANAESRALDRLARKIDFKLNAMADRNELAKQEDKWMFRI